MTELSLYFLNNPFSYYLTHHHTVLLKIVATRNIFKKIYDEGYISRLFSKIIMISNHIAFVLLLFSSANFITDSNKYTIAS